MISLALHATLALAEPLSVTGDSACPRPAQVAAEAAPLVPEGAGSHRATIVEEPRALRLTLLGADGAPLVTRVFPRDPSCAALASAMAVTIAAWTSEVEAEFVGTLSGRARTPAAAVAARPRSAPGAGFELGAGLSGALSPTADSLGASAGALLHGALLGARWRARATFGVETEHAAPLAGGEVRWRRTSGSLGIARALRPAAARLQADAHLGVALGWLAVRGSGFVTAGQSGALDPAATGGLRLALSTGRLRPFAELGVTAFGKRREVVVTDPARVRSLPPWQAGLTLGVSHCFCQR